MSEDKLQELRTEIDRIDGEIVKLLNTRAIAAEGIGKAKSRAEGPTYAPQREEVVLEGVRKLAGEFPADAVVSVFKEVISGCRSLQKGLRVGFLGPMGTFTHQAALAHFGSAPELVQSKSINQVFSDVSSGDVNFGVVPVENSLEGSVRETLDLLVQGTVHIVGEVATPINHQLIGKKGATINRIVSHPQALAQCRRFIASNYPRAELVPTISTVEGVRRAKDELHTAALGSKVAAEAYELAVLQSNVQDHSDNFTRFFVIAKEPLTESKGPNWKTSCLLTLQHEAGALLSALKSFAEAGVNLAKIESRPSKTRKWEYVFFVDIHGGASEPAVIKALNTINSNGAALVLGSYPASDF